MASWIFKQSVATAVATFCFLNFITGVSAFPLDEDLNTLALENLGTVDGKTFYADTRPFWTWERAGVVCTEAGYRLAAIETKEESAFLAATLITRNPLDWYWTSARNSNLLEGMQWNTTEGVPGSDIFEEFVHINSTYTHCGAVVGVPNNEKLFMRVYLCDAKMKFICEHS